MSRIASRLDGTHRITKKGVPIAVVSLGDCTAAISKCLRSEHWFVNWPYPANPPWPTESRRFEDEDRVAMFVQHHRARAASQVEPPPEYKESPL